MKSALQSIAIILMAILFCFASCKKDNVNRYWLSNCAIHKAIVNKDTVYVQYQDVDGIVFFVLDNGKINGTQFTAHYQLLSSTDTCFVNKY